MKVKNFLPLLLAAAILLSALYAAGRDVRKNQSGVSSPSENKSEYTQPEELRGVWVSFLSLDTEGEEDIRGAFSQKISDIISDMKEANLNTMIVQVRPFSDALYRSEIYPWSHILTGHQGEDPGFDPLALICEQSHENDISVHAWVNPYRVSTKNSPKELSEYNPYLLHKEMGIELESGVYLDPSNKDAQQLIISGVKEIVEHYDVDGIQFDDYFYPTQDESFDKEAYDAYRQSASSPLSLSDWRMENVNELIKEVYRTVHETKDNTVFGIAPQGNMKNNDTLYADVKRWCKEEGFIDYICPQIYFSLDNPALSFEDGLSDWLSAEKHESLSLYVGLGSYKAGTDADEGTWLDNNDILKTEIEIIREEKLAGFILYSYESFKSEENHEEIENVISYLVSSADQDGHQETTSPSQ